MFSAKISYKWCLDFISLNILSNIFKCTFYLLFNIEHHLHKKGTASIPAWRRIILDIF